MRAATLFFAMLFSACAARSSAPAARIASLVPEASPAPATVPSAPPWGDLADSRIWTEAAPPLPALSHGRPGTRIHVFVNPEALAAYRSLVVDRPLGDGARLLALEENARGDRLGASLLEKRAGAWFATRFDARGAELPGDPSACLGCHAQAPTDHLFGITQRLPPAAP